MGVFVVEGMAWALQVLGGCVVVVSALKMRSGASESCFAILWVLLEVVVIG